MIRINSLSFFCSIFEMIDLGSFCWTVSDLGDLTEIKAPNIVICLPVRHALNNNSTQLATLICGCFVFFEITKKWIFRRSVFALKPLNYMASPTNHEQISKWFVELLYNVYCLADHELY